jgi:hypothetical protein
VGARVPSANANGFQEANPLPIPVIR